MKKIIGLSIVIMFAFLVLGGDVAEAAKCDAATQQEIGGVCFPLNTGLPGEDGEVTVTGSLTIFAGWLAFIFGTLSIITFIICGMQYLFSAGDDSQAENAKRCMKWGIVGVIVAGSSFIIVKTIIQILSLGAPVA